MDVRTALDAIAADAARGDIVFPTHTDIALRVQRLLEEQFPDQGASPLALVAAPRADASFDDMNDAVAELDRRLKKHYTHQE